ncbi:hypothetical protein Pcinc_010875 [Petrolisthes cinctipes]|uniref:Uncharacterized protein n=1 Tax=Petrolisthes cinctipes TaxID=88211 RepID=A0AAE1KT79_PETCI|nr:hypothetical protein Pcinc_010875 [Petrolisthes cinctipes]
MCPSYLIPTLHTTCCRWTTPSYATLPPLHSPPHLDHSPAPHHALHRATLHTLCCSTAPLSTPRLYANHDAASDTPPLHSPIHASTPPTMSPPVHEVFF